MALSVPAGKDRLIEQARPAADLGLCRSSRQRSAYKIGMPKKQAFAAECGEPLPRFGLYLAPLAVPATESRAAAERGSHENLAGDLPRGAVWGRVYGGSRHS